jgi:BlaI family penicillinase repressor
MDELSIGDRELDIMGVLWELGSGTATEVRDRLADDLAYNTVLTLLRRLEVKGFLRREAEGKAHRYFPAVKRRQAQVNAVARVVDKLFAGSPENLVAHLVDERKLTSEQLAALRRRLTDETKRRSR